jgi:predicted phage-related endonuclease
MRATLDGLDAKENVLVEIKTCRIVHEEVPVYYYPQLQHQMEVVGLDWMYYFSYDGRQGKSLRVERDPEYCETLIKKEKEFWDRVQEGCLDLSDSEDFNHHMIKLAELKAVKKDITEQESFHLSQLILFSDGCAAKGVAGVLLQTERKGTIDYSHIPELKAVDLESYRKPSTTYWSVKGV